MHFDDATTQKSGPVLYVDDDSAFVDAELPAGFTSARLDTDPACLDTVRRTMGELYRALCTVYCRLELVERALRQSAPHSERARAARRYVRRALADLQDDPVNNLDQATLAFHRDLTALHEE